MRKKAKKKVKSARVGTNAKVEEFAIEQFETFTGKLSDISRQLALAGIAIVWIFAGSTVDSSKIPHLLWKALAAFVACLMMDVLQYLYATTAWGWLTLRNGLILEPPKPEGGGFTEWIKRLEVRLTFFQSSVKLDPMRGRHWWAINQPTNIFFYMKVGLLLVGYGKVIWYFLGQRGV